MNKNCAFCNYWNRNYVCTNKNNSNYGKVRTETDKCNGTKNVRKNNIAISILEIGG